MLRLLTASICMSVCAVAQESALSLYLQNSEIQPADVVQAARAEMSRVLEPLNLDLNWRTARQPDDEAAILVVVRFAGSCLFSDYNPNNNTRMIAGLPLASTAVSNGRVLPFVTLECGRVRDRIAVQVVGWRDAQRNAALGRAVGRVLAHEIYHVLTGDRKHAREGIASSCVSTRDLLADRFDLDEDSIAQMRPPRPPAVVSDEPGTEATGR